ncbi:MAG: vWA domain-containing protein [Pseudomonadota bacterium]
MSGTGSGGAGGNAATSGDSGGSPAETGGTPGAGGMDPAGGSAGEGSPAGTGATSSGGSTETGAGGRRDFSYDGRGGAQVILKPEGGSAGAAPICSELSVVPKPVVPSVMIVVDNSSSMFEPRAELWDRLYTTLMDPGTGVVKALEEQVRFGFASFKGSNQPYPETDPRCAEITSVDIDLNNHAAIDAVYAELGTAWMPGLKWETPTGHAITRIAAELAEYMPDPPGPKYILLVTDGNPNTCQILDPQCGQDASVAAVQKAYELGIGTFVIGIGDIVTMNTGCVPQQMRCGVAHLQDLANAGTGQPVEAPPNEYQFQQCVTMLGGLQATYATTEEPGTAPYFTATSAEELKLAIENLLKQVASCTFDMDVEVRGRASLGQVSVGNQQVPYNDPDGWRLESNRYQVTLLGAACELFRTGEHELKISFPCDPDTGEPVAVKR